MRTKLANLLVRLGEIKCLGAEATFVGGGKHPLVGRQGAGGTHNVAADGV